MLEERERVLQGDCVFWGLGVEWGVVVGLEWMDECGIEI